jgi:hypothetical protein
VVSSTGSQRKGDSNQHKRENPGHSGEMHPILETNGAYGTSKRRDLKPSSNKFLPVSRLHGTV